MTWVRNTMYEKLKPITSTFCNGNLLTLGGESLLLNFLGENVNIIITNIPAVDAEKTGFEDNSWDYIISDQMLEHTEHPWKVADEMYRILKPGGRVVCTTCGYNPIHNRPADYYRFLPEGLKILFEKFNNVFADCWGDRNAMIYDIQTNGGRKSYPEEKNERLLRRMIYSSHG